MPLSKHRLCIVSKLTCFKWTILFHVCPSFINDYSIKWEIIYIKIYGIYGIYGIYKRIRSKNVKFSIHKIDGIENNGEELNSNDGCESILH